MTFRSKKRKINMFDQSLDNKFIMCHRLLNIKVKQKHDKPILVKHSLKNFCKKKKKKKEKLKKRVKEKEITIKLCTHSVLFIVSELTFV